ncbi:WecB/TagA/CpsF family glycosyltransferase [Anabaena sphaerica FACHB-251]|uniref:WecB/TagA/CpsF family glycosyltransferase n=1 Tax=Anabaena sphaerica FACHB-251 TaxID=2692883 RepID=A0A926WKU6_9NOST|nr:WecB/TagA/CpsF family glycosyltransferase [Anabaena sphaerica]MBD2296476.1 WecB/TagA/CpsF family glycosyltransferase [Anabaena sphaerica FACHB-251]
MLTTNNQIQVQSLSPSLEFAASKIPTKIDVIGSPVTALPFEVQINMILEWAMSKISKVVCVANTHMLVEAYWHPDFSSVLKNADIVTPDGMPLVWMLRLMGAGTQNRVAGMDILLSLCRLAPLRDIHLFFLGSEIRILEKMRYKLERVFPNVKIAGMEPLPFRPLTFTENEAIIKKINDSGAGIVLVALGCPKQEYWMNQNKDKIQAVMIGLGGAFPVFAESHKRAPYWIRHLGGEWFYRLIQEPLRLFRRYSTTIPVFIWLALKQLLNLALVKGEQRENVR